MSATVLTGCTSTDDAPSPAPSESVTAQSDTEVQDPLLRITDLNSSDFVATKVDPIINEQGTGSTAFSIDSPDAGMQVRFYVACSPASQFTITMGTFFQGGCAPEFQNWGQLPGSPDNDELEVQLTLPQGVNYWIVGIPIEMGNDE
jgi:hypothetical protein